MGRIYQRQKNNKYILPQVVYHQTIWQIRDYYRLKEMADDILFSCPDAADGMPRIMDVSDEIIRKVIKREKLLFVISAIDAEKSHIPKEYREEIWGNILFGKPYPLIAGRATYGRYKSRFVYNVAKRLFLI